MLTEFEEVMTCCDQVLFLSLDKVRCSCTSVIAQSLINFNSNSYVQKSSLNFQKTCHRRRLTRSYEPPDVDGYFDEVAWPAYIQHQKKAFEIARTDPRFSFLDVSSECDEATEENLTQVGKYSELINKTQLIQSFTNDIVRISSGLLSVEEATRLVTSPSCGGISIFVGTTRDYFEGKKVLRLEYECYDEMAYKELRKLCYLVREKYPSVQKIVVMHRFDFHVSMSKVPTESVSSQQKKPPSSLLPLLLTEKRLLRLLNLPLTN